MRGGRKAGAVQEKETKKLNCRFPGLQAPSVICFSEPIMKHSHVLIMRKFRERWVPKFCDLSLIIPDGESHCQHTCNTAKRVQVKSWLWGKPTVTPSRSPGAEPPCISTSEAETEADFHWLPVKSHIASCLCLACTKGSDRYNLKLGRKEELAPVAFCSNYHLQVIL